MSSVVASSEPVSQIAAASMIGSAAFRQRSMICDSLRTIMQSMMCVTVPPTVPDYSPACESACCLLSTAGAFFVKSHGA
jgi:hypothetical protein